MTCLRFKRFLQAGVIFIASSFYSFAMASETPLFLQKNDVSAALSPYAYNNEFPSHIKFKESKWGRINYTFDQGIHQFLSNLYQRHKPDYACFVVIDPETGAILNLSSFIKEPEEWPNLAMLSEYPAASIFKVIVAAAGIDSGLMTPDTVFRYNGKSTSLYKKQVLSHKDGKYTRTPNLQKAFAKSINPVFGQIGVFKLGEQGIRNYASEFGFDDQMQTDFSIASSEVRLPLDNQWALAEAGSGFTTEITLSPIHAAQIAATIINDGKSMTPYMVSSIDSLQGDELYRASEQEGKKVIDSLSAEHLQKMMHATTRIGSARRTFRDASRYKVFNGMSYGGKTGSLTGFAPKGRHDWFVGFGEKDGRKVAYASLIINKEKWVIRSAYVARQFLQYYFKDAPKPSVASVESTQ